MDNSSHQLEVFGRRTLKIAQKRASKEEKEQKFREFVQQNQYALDLLRPIFSAMDENETREQRVLRERYEEKKYKLWCKQNGFEVKKTI